MFAIPILQRSGYFHRLHHPDLHNATDVLRNCLFLYSQAFADLSKFKEETLTKDQAAPTSSRHSVARNANQYASQGSCNPTDAQLCSKILRPQVATLSYSQCLLHQGRSAVTSVPVTSISSPQLYSTHNTHSTSRNYSGLFGIWGLQEPRDFLFRFQKAIDTCDYLMRQIHESPANANVIQLMDDMSDQLCKVYDAAEACRNFHADRAWREAATTVCIELGKYISKVNQDYDLYVKLRAALSAYERGVHASQVGFGPMLDSHELKAYTPEALLVGRKLLQDMEQAGIDLPHDSQKRMQELSNANLHFAAQFSHNLTDANTLGTFTLGGINPFKHVRIRLDSGNLTSALCSIDDENSRRQLYLAGYRSPARNQQLLDQIIAVRRELAHALGYQSYAAYKLAGNSLAATPAAVQAFLQQLAETVRPRAMQELQVLQRLKREHVSSQSAASQMLHAWDYDYYLSRAKKQLKPISSASVADYLHLPCILQGFSDLFKQVFGVTLRIQEASKLEAWAPHILRVDLDHEELGHMGVIYLDLCSRPNKPQSAVTYPIRCGRALPDGSYQTPLLVLLADFGAEEPSKMVLSWRDLRLLAHELGHCMHSALCRTHFQHLWGTRCAQDVVEVPSHIFEYFVQDPRTLALVARHKDTKEPLPAQVAQQLAVNRKAFAGLDLQWQVCLALTDQAYFGQDHLAPGGTSAVWHNIAAKYSSIPTVPETSPELRISHFTIYGGTYYTYLYARCMAAAAWQKYLAADPLNPEAGRQLAQTLLVPGGSIEPLQLMQGVLGPQALQQQNGGWAPRAEACLLAAA